MCCTMQNRDIILYIYYPIQNGRMAVIMVTRHVFRDRFLMTLSGNIHDICI